MGKKNCASLTLWPQTLYGKRLRDSPPSLGFYCAIRGVAGKTARVYIFLTCGAVDRRDVGLADEDDDGLLLLLSGAQLQAALDEHDGLLEDFPPQHLAAHRRQRHHAVH